MVQSHTVTKSEYESRGVTVFGHGFVWIVWIVMSPRRRMISTGVRTRRQEVITLEPDKLTASEAGEVPQNSHRVPYDAKRSNRECIKICWNVQTESEF